MPAVVGLWVGAPTGCEPLGSFRGSRPDPGTDAEAPLLVALPTVLDFGTVSATTPATRGLTLVNAGEHPVTVYGHDQPLGLLGDDASVFRVDAEPVLELEPDRQVDLQVEFVPTTDGRWEASLMVQPGDQRIDLVGRGSAPVIGVEEPDGTAATIGCENSVPVDIYNQGSEVLTVDALEVDDPWDAWQLAADPVPAQVRPGERLRVRYTFAPRYDADSHGLRPATLTVWSNDPASPRTALQLDGLALQVDGVEERFTYSPGASIDLLVVADTDGVMGLRIPEVTDALPALVTGLQAAGASLHSTVVTGGSPCPQTFPVYADVTVERDARVDALAEGLSGDPGVGSDRLGEHAAAALAQAVPGACLEGFLRPGARLHVLLVAGDDDLSTLQPATQLARLQAEAPNASRVTVSAILPTDTYGCDGTVYSPAYAELAASTDGALVDICADDLPGAVVAIADAAVAELEAALEHPLGRPPIPESLEVTVDGEPWSDFTYRPEDRTLVFPATAPPRAGAQVVVSYRAADDC